MRAEVGDQQVPTTDLWLHETSCSSVLKRVTLGADPVSPPNGLSAHEFAVLGRTILALASPMISSIILRVGGGILVHLEH